MVNGLGLLHDKGEGAMILGNIRCCIPSDVGISRSLESSIT
jgi:hypothetical protein